MWNFLLRKGSGVRKFRAPLLFLAAIGMLAVLLSAGTANAAIGFAQGVYATPQTPQSSVSVTFPKAQAAGNLNVVVVGWNDTTAAVNSVTDSVGNVYTLAVGPTKNPGSAGTFSLTQSIYYARGIFAAGAGTNTMTVRFTVPAQYADIRVLEYSGLDQLNPVDVTAAAIGTDAASNSGTATTTHADDLIFGANIVFTYNSGPGTGFTNRMITSPDGDIVEDRVVTTAGSYSATAPLSRSGPWIMQMVAFKAASGAAADSSPPTAPSNLLATSAGSGGINLSWTASSDNVGVTNYLIQRCQGPGCTTFAQVATSTTTTFSDAGLLPNTSYDYQVRATDAAGNLSGYSNTSVATTQQSTASPISFVQLAYATPQSAQLTVPVTFGSTQTSGNLNVVVVGWNDTTAAVNSVTDSVGNVYTLAVGPTAYSGFLTQAIYYAKNIVSASAGANTVTVQFTVAAQHPDIRILEYAGIDPVNPVDVVASAIGTTTASTSGAATTTNANDLIFGANTVFRSVVGAGVGFTKRVITSPDTDLAEDMVVSAAGSYSASAAINATGPWVMQMVAFRGGLTGASPGPAYPVKVGPTGRYLVDQRGVPFLILGESPQAMIGKLSEADADLFLSNRKSHGFNTVWINLLCASYTGCNADGTTFDGIAPFTTGTNLSTYDVSTPNEAYFARADRMLQLAAKYGILVILDPAETGSWLTVLRSNGLAKARAYGRYLGTRYKDFPNIIWMSGNDFQSWRTSPSDDALVREVALGIKETDPNHIHTVELNDPVSSSLDDSSWAPLSRSMPRTPIPRIRRSAPRAQPVRVHARLHERDQLRICEPVRNHWRDCSARDWTS
jgi:chitodextrinase